MSVIVTDNGFAAALWDMVEKHGGGHKDGRPRPPEKFILVDGQRVDTYEEAKEIQARNFLSRMKSTDTEVGK